MTEFMNDTPYSTAALVMSMDWSGPTFSLFDATFRYQTRFSIARHFTLDEHAHSEILRFNS